MTKPVILSHLLPSRYPFRPTATLVGCGTGSMLYSSFLVDVLPQARMVGVEKHDVLNWQSHIQTNVEMLQDGRKMLGQWSRGRTQPRLLPPMVVHVLSSSSSWAECEK